MFWYKFWAARLSTVFYAFYSKRLSCAGSIIESILLKPYPTRAIRSEGSLKGSLPQGMKSTFLPYKLFKSFSQLAHEKPPSGLLLNMASSLESLPPLLRNKSKRFLSYLSRSFIAFLVSALSANYLVNTVTMSFILDKISFSSSPNCC